MKNIQSFIYLLISQTIANAGDIFYLVSIIGVAYSKTDSILLVSLIPFVNTFSRFLGGVFAPYLLEKYNLKYLLVGTSFIKGFTLGLLAVLYLMDINTLYMAYTLFFVCLIALLDSLSTPARNTLLPSLVGKDSLVRANSLTAMSDQTIQLAGWPLGTLLIVLMDESLLIILTSIIFILVGAVTMLIRNTDTKSKIIDKSDTKASLKEGWIYIWNTPPLKIIFTVDMITSLTGAIWIAAILYVYVEDVLSKNEVWWGYINSTFFGGLIVGSLICFWLEKKLNLKSPLILIISTILVSLLTFLFAFPYNSLVALVISILIGIPTQIQEITQLTIIQSNTDENKLSKVFSARDVVLTCFFGFSSLLVGALAELLDVRSIFIMGSILLFVSSVIYFIKRKTLNEL